MTGRTLNILPETGAVDFSVLYQVDTSYLIFQATEYTGKTVHYEKNSNDVEIYTCGDIDHYLFVNNDNTNVATWHVDGVEYAIGSNLAIADIKDVIDSMY